MDTVDSISYVKAWRDYKRRRNVVLISFLGFMPFCFVISQLADILHLDNKVVFALCVCWLWGFPLSATIWAQWPCPRCGKPFAVKNWFFVNQFTVAKCVHCGLTKDELKQAERQALESRTC